MEPSNSFRSPSAFFDHFISKYSRVLIVLLALLSFGVSINNEYNLDDDFVTRYESIGDFKEIFTSYYTTSKEGDQYEFRPFTQLTFAIEQTLFGKNPHVGHAVNLLLYILICTMVFQLYSKVIGESMKYTALIAVILFTVHPIHTEVVVSLKNREVLLMTVFGLSLIFSTIKYNETGNIKHFIVGCLLVLLLMLTQMSGIAFIPLAIFSGWIFNDKGLKRSLTALGGYGLLSALYILFLLSVFPELGRDGVDLSVEIPLYKETDIGLRLMTGLKLGVVALKLMVFPYPQSYFYGYNVITLAALNQPIVWLGGALFLTGTYLALKNAPRKNPASFGWLYFILAFSIYSNIFIAGPGFIGERHLFNPSLGFCLMMGYGFDRLIAARPLRPAACVLLIGVFALMIWKSIDRSKDWYNKETLFTRDMEYNPRSIGVQFHTADYFLSKGIESPPGEERKENLRKAVSGYSRVNNEIPLEHLQTRIKNITDELNDSILARDHYKKYMQTNSFSYDF